jgi:hypothetical protein
LAVESKATMQSMLMANTTREVAFDHVVARFLKAEVVFRGVLSVESLLFFGV